MTRRRGRLLLVFLALGGVTYGVYAWLSDEPRPPAAEPPKFTDTGKQLSPAEKFAELARTDPVAMLTESLTRYTREVKGFTTLLDKRERVAGKMHDPELIRVAVEGDVPDPAAAAGSRPMVKVRMLWDQGPQKDTLGNPIRATLYVEGQNKNQILAWRPEAFIKEWSIDAKGSNARGASRYCIRDTGLYQTMLRTHAVWAKAQKANEFRFEYEGVRSVEKLGGRPCHVVRRLCPRVEADAFALDEEPPTDPKVLERDGFDSVTILVDVEGWYQTGTEVRRGADLIGAYYYRDLELNPTFAPDTFTAAGIKAAGKK